MWRSIAVGALLIIAGCAALSDDPVAYRACQGRFDARDDFLLCMGRQMARRGTLTYGTKLWARVMNAATPGFPIWYGGPEGPAADECRTRFNWAYETMMFNRCLTMVDPNVPQVPMPRVAVPVAAPARVAPPPVSVVAQPEPAAPAQPAQNGPDWNDIRDFIDALRPPPPVYAVPRMPQTTRCWRNGPYLQCSTW
jgi:hypothetical protein